MSNKKFSRNKQEKIELIYDTFFDLITKKGYHKTSTNHVAKSAKISIGTIYKYFPEGKKDILRKYFDQSMKTVVDKDQLVDIDNNNIRAFLNQFIIQLYRNHEEKKGYNLAFRVAIQSDKSLLEDYKARLYADFKDLAQYLRENNETFKLIPEGQLIEIFIFVYKIINAIVYHHLAVIELFDTNEKLVDYLSNMIAFSLDYLNEKMVKNK